MISLRKILFLLAVLGLFLTATSAIRAAEAWITVDAKTGFVLEKFQAEKKRQIGSVTSVPIKAPITFAFCMPLSLP